MNITFVVPGLNISGGMRVIAMYARKLEERGHNVTVVAPKKSIQSLLEKIKIYILSKFRQKYKSNKSASSFFDIMNVPVRFAKKAGPITNDDVPDSDIIISCFWVVTEWVSKFSSSKGKKINFIQGYESWPGMNTSRLDSTWNLPIKKIVVSNWLKEIAYTKFKSESFVVPNSIDFDYFNAIPRNKQKKFTVGFIYNPIWCKASEIAVEACRLASTKIPNMQIVIFGQERPENVIFPFRCQSIWNPSQDLLPQLYSSCDVWLWSSRQEGFGLPILEAMACRTPVIATCAGAAPELLADGRGFLVHFDNPKEICDKIMYINNLSEVEWKVISDKVYNYARSYTWDNATDLFEKILIEIYNDF